MERASDKHGPRLDDELRHETEGMIRGRKETRAEEWHSVEPAGEDQPEVDHAPDRSLRGGTPQGMTDADVAARSELASQLAGAAFPAVREQLLWHAQDAHAPDRVLDWLRRLPAGREFHNASEVWAALGGPTERQRF